MARILFVGVLAVIAVLVASAVIVALAPYIAAVGIICVVVAWYEKDKAPEPEQLPPAKRAIKVIDSDSS